MTRQVINTGTLPNDGTGDTLLSAMQKINANFTDLYATSYSSNTVNSFNNRTGAVSLLTADITGALGYTPANKAGDTFTGLVVLNNGFVAGQSGVFDSNVAGVGTLPAAPTGTMIRAINSDATQTVLNLDSFVNAGGTMSAFTMRGSRGIGSAPTAVQSTDVIGQIGVFGYATTQFNTSPSAQINFVSEGGFTNASTPTAIAFQVTATGSATPSELMRLTSAGNLILNGTGALQIPVGNTGQQPSPSVQGMIRFNTTTSRFENYNGAAWVNHVKLAGDTMTGTLTAPALVGTTGAATLDSFVIGSITPEAATVTNLTATGTLTGFAGRLINVQTFTSSGTYTPTAGTNSVIVEGSGGGGAGGGSALTSSTQIAVGSGGGAGAFGRVRVTTVTSQTVTITAGGTAGAAGAAGNAGGAASIGTWLACPGGAGGAAGAAVAFATVMAQTAPSAGGTVATSSGAGVTALFLSGGEPSSSGSSTYGAGNAASGQGGSGFYGSGGIPVVTSSAGIAATGKGAGGSGSTSLASQASALAGGAGTNGIIIVYEYA